MIDISKMPKPAVLAALYNAAKPGNDPGDSEHRRLSFSEAGRLLKERTYFDYLYGRSLKVELMGEQFDETLYDIDQGPDAAKNALRYVPKNPIQVSPPEPKIRRKKRVA
jgi:hypothetical protein